MSHIVHCKECNRNVPVIDIKFIAFEKCPECKLWSDYAILKDDKNSVRIAGNQYWIGSETTCDKGFGGQQYILQPLDKRKKMIVTTNLNGCGTIPGIFIKRLPDNMEFSK